jgi:hypothetical protein
LETVATSSTSRAIVTRSLRGNRAIPQRNLIGSSEELTPTISVHMDAKRPFPVYPSNGYIHKTTTNPIQLWYTTFVSLSVPPEHREMT